MTKLIYTNAKKCVIEDHKEISIDAYIKNVDIDKEVFNYLQFLENQEIGGLQLEDLYLYNNIGMYCFERHSIYEKLKGIFYCFFVLESIIKKCKEELVVETDNMILSDLCSEIFHVKVINTQCERKDLSAKKLNAGVIFKLALRNLKGIKNYFKFLIKRRNGKENFLSVSNVMNINKVNINGCTALIDTQLGITVKALSENYNMFNLQYLFDFKQLDKSLKYKEDYIPFELFLIFKRLSKDKYIDKNLIKDDLDKLGLLDYKYKNYELKDVVTKYVFKDIKNRYLDDIRELVCAKRLIEKLNIKRCIVVDEGDRPREFIVASNMNNLKTFALQHGILSEMSPAYIMKSKYKDNIVPKITFVWGQKYKDILLRNTNMYNDENVKVVGQNRTDLLKQYIGKPEKNKDDKIRILYATQYFKDILEPATNILFKALSLMNKDYEIVIKLHPADVYYDTYKSLISKYEIKNANIIKDGDIYELIDWCDVVVSVHSTVVIEGALLNKPSICILLPKYNDAGGFVRDGISIGVKDEIELKERLDNIHEFKFDSKFNEYMEYNFYKIDGKVTERIVNSIKNF